MKRNSIELDHINIAVRNVQESIKFYHDIFDFKLVEAGDPKNDWGIMRNGSSMICLAESEKKPLENALKINHFAFRVSDIESIIEKIKKRNIEFLYGGEVIYPHSSSWYIHDPNGHCIEIVKWNNDEIKFNS